MVKVAVVLVKIQEQHGAAPYLRVGHQRLQHLRRKVRALRRAGHFGML
jgi:hypothetical protein